MPPDKLGIVQMAKGAGYGQFFAEEDGMYLNPSAPFAPAGYELGTTQTGSGGGYGSFHTTMKN